MEARAAELGVRLPTPVLARIEQGTVDPSVRRLFTLMYVFHKELLGDALEIGALASG